MAGLSCSLVSSRAQPKEAQRPREGLGSGAGESPCLLGYGVEVAVHSAENHSFKTELTRVLKPLSPLALSGLGMEGPWCHYSPSGLPHLQLHLHLWKSSVD